MNFHLNPYLKIMDKHIGDLKKDKG